MADKGQRSDRDGESMQGSLPESQELGNAVSERPQHLKMMQDIQDVLRRIGQVINTSTLYGQNHNLTEQAADEAFGALEVLLEECPRINLSVSEGNLLVEGSSIDGVNPFVNMLCARLVELQIAGFSLLRGMPEDEFSSLIEILTAPAILADEGGGFLDALADRNMEFIQPERVKYERVTEGEAVVNKEELTESEESGPSGQAVEQILAFLKGDVRSVTTETGQHLEEISSDTDTLANLILEAAAVRQESDFMAAGESLADVVVGCLRRGFSGLMKQPSAQTKKGRKNIKKALLMLEKNILDKLHEMAGEKDPALDAAIDAAVEEMKDEVEVEDLAIEYLKKKEAFKNTEKRVIRYMDKHNPEELEESELGDRLKNGGLSESDWHELLIQEKNSPVPTPAGEIVMPLAGQDVIGGLGSLATLLSEMDRMMAASEVNHEEVLGKVAQVNEGVDTLSDSTRQKIEVLDDKIQDAQQALDAVDKTQADKVRMSQDAMMELLAEIVQELCQSLSAINCAVSMTRAGHIGDVNSEQNEVLGVAQKCGQRLDELLNRIIEIVGLPESLEPDKESVYCPRP